MEQRRVEFDGFTWELHLPSNIDTEIEEGRQWDLDVYEWCKLHIKPGSIAVDVGANFGVITMPMSRAVGPRGRVYAFEPCRAFSRRLRRHLEINTINNVSVEECALGGQCGPGLCMQEGPPYYSTAWVKREYKKTTYGVEAVDVITLDRFFLTRKPPEFIKIDTNGSELEVLDGAIRIIRESHPTIVIELQRGDDGVEAAGWLVDQGYILRDCQNRASRSPGHFGPTNKGGTVNVLAQYKGS